MAAESAPYPRLPVEKIRNIFENRVCRVPLPFPSSVVSLGKFATSRKESWSFHKTVLWGRRLSACVTIQVETNSCKRF